MKSKEEQLVELLLKKEGPTPGNVIASEMNTSRRSIISYVSNINKLTGKKAIISTNKGYSIVPELVTNIFDNHSKNIPQSYLERAYYLIKLILIEHKKIDMFEICDELFISYSTLKSDIKKFNITFERFNVKFRSKNSDLLIEGSEVSKRKLISFVIFEETNNGFVDIEQLNIFFGKAWVKSASALINAISDKYQFVLNDYAYKNILIHILIMAERSRTGDNMLNNNDNLETLSKRDCETMNLIKNHFELNFNVNINEYEQFEILTLFKSNINDESSTSTNKIELEANKKVQDIVNEVVTDVYNNYGVDLSDDTFKVSFIIHLKLFFNRVYYNHYSKNPLTETIKYNCPLIYDIAVFITDKLKKYIAFPNVEDEIAYFAIHIGTELERQNSLSDKVRCALLCPDYLDLREKLQNQLLSMFSNDIILIKAVSNLSELENEDFSLLISIAPCVPTEKYYVYNISSNIFDNPFEKFSEKIRMVKRNTKKKTLIENFSNYFHEDLFIVDNDISTKDEAIKLLCAMMLKKGFVHKDFHESVLRREATSSTAFNKIAIPHAMEMDAIKTSVAVLVSKIGITWGDSIVNLILLPSVTGFEKHEFAGLYEALLNIFSSTNILSFSQEVNTFKDFKNYIIQE